MNSFAIKTLGCKVNSYESDAARNDLLSFGYIEHDFNNLADIYIINTCSVTNNADSKSRNMISKARRNNPNALVIVMGCYSQVNSKEILALKLADIIIGNKYKNDLISLIKAYENNKEKIVKISNLMIEKEFEKNDFVINQNKTRAYLKIQDGCNFMCSYCIIPFTRGKQRSQAFNSIINEVKLLSKSGYREIVLTGVNIAGYINEEYTFYDLLVAINKIEGDFRIRISSIEPFQITDEMIEVITTNKNRFANHWHICLQSGSNNVLEKMHRKYTTNDIRILFNKIRTKSSDVSISTDVIAGFPTETETDHLETIKFIKEMKFSSLHVFPFSTRKNTKASNYLEVDSKIKKIRTDELIKLSHELVKNYLKTFVNKEVRVIFESSKNNLYEGKTSEYVNCIYRSNEEISTNNIGIFLVEKVFLNNLILKVKK